VWRQLLRDGQTVARCTIARLMAADTTAEYVQDWMQRQCHAERPNQLWVADFTCVSDVFERRVVGWCRALARQRRRRL
jgi:transposase InsO family protein